MGRASLGFVASAISILAGCSGGTTIESARTSDPGTGGGGGGAPPAAELDILGTWYSCEATLSFRPDGTWRSESRLDGCVEEGHWALDGHSLDRWTDTSNCGGGASEPLLGIGVARPDGALVIYESFGEGVGERIYLDGTAPRSSWKLEGDQTNNPGKATSAAVIVGRPHEGGLASACYWSTNGPCGGLFSCGGRIEYWVIDGAKFIGQTSCIGDCPCGSTINGEVLPDGSVDATFYASNCGGNASGHFLGVVTKEN